MKFAHTYDAYLSTVNSKGECCVIRSGDEINLQLDYGSQYLSSKKAVVEQYPDGWVPGIVSSLADDGKIISLFQPKTCCYLRLEHSDILDVDSRSKKKGLTIKDIEHLLPRYADGSGFDVQIIYKEGHRLLAFEHSELYRPNEHPEQRNLEIISLLPGLTRSGGHYDDTFAIVVHRGAK